MARGKYSAAERYDALLAAMPATDDSQTMATRMSRAAGAWLDSLSPEQRRVGAYPSPATDPAVERERTTWFYTPTDHGGLPLRHQRPAQQQLAMKLLATGLTFEGYVAATTIMGLENVLDRIENFQMQWDRERGRDNGMYYVRVFGDPVRDGAWGWRVGGHHLSVHFLIVDGLIVANTPFFLGADPAAAPLPGGSWLRPLGGIEDLARTFVRTLTNQQRQHMQLLDRAISDIVTGRRPHITDGDEMIHAQDLWRRRFTDPRLAAHVDNIDLRAETGSGFTPADHQTMAYTAKPKGLNTSDLRPAQREALLALISAATVGPVPTANPAPAWDDETLSQLHIAWGGRLDEPGPVYFRIQAPHLLFEYDNTQRDANHAHTVLRNPTNDFGGDSLRAHRAAINH